jgi:hypothetical protein
MTNDHTNLFLLCARRGEESFPLYFESYDMLLATRATVATGEDLGLTLEEDGSNRMLFHSSEDAVETLRLWAGGLVPTTISEVRESAPARSGTKADQMIEMLQSPNGASAQEIADAFGIKKASATSRISVETRKRKLNARLIGGRYHIV